MAALLFQPAVQSHPADKGKKINEQDYSAQGASTEIMAHISWSEPQEMEFLAARRGPTAMGHGRSYLSLSWPSLHFPQSNVASSGRWRNFPHTLLCPPQSRGLRHPPIPTQREVNPAPLCSPHKAVPPERHTQVRRHQLQHICKLLITQLHPPAQGCSQHPPGEIPITTHLQFCWSTSASSFCLRRLTAKFRT